MNGFRFGERSRENLKGVAPELIAVVYRGLYLSPHDFGITEGLRTPERQRQLVADGKSQTFHSKHLVGRAVDFVVWVDGKITWEFRYYAEVADALKQAADEFGVAVVWGGDWKTFKDGPHLELR